MKAQISDLKEGNFYLKELAGNECACMKEKKPGHSFCWSCYRSLDYGMQQELYRKIGQGYEQAYEAAYKRLVEIGAIS